MKHKIVLEGMTFVFNIKTCKRCEKIGVSLSKRSGICIDCIKESNWTRLLPIKIRHYTSKDIILMIREKTVEILPIKRKKFKSKWDVCDDWKKVDKGD